MKKIITTFVLATFLVAQNISMAVYAKQSIKLSNNTRIKVSTMDNINSSLDSQGKEVSFQVAENIKAGNKTVIKSGTVVTGNVVTLENRSFLEKPGKITVELMYTTAVDGTRIPLRGTYSVIGTSKIGKMVALSVILTPLFLFMKGDHAVISAGTKFNGYVDQDCYVSL